MTETSLFLKETKNMCADLFRKSEKKPRLSPREVSPEASWPADGAQR
jgi:hypothetical protein